MEAAPRWYQRVTRLGGRFTLGCWGCRPAGGSLVLEALGLVFHGCISASQQDEWSSTQQPLLRNNLFPKYIYFGLLFSILRSLSALIVLKIRAPCLVVTRPGGRLKKAGSLERRPWGPAQREGVIQRKCVQPALVRCSITSPPFDQQTAASRNIYLCGNGKNNKII